MVRGMSGPRSFCISAGFRTHEPTSAPSRSRFEEDRLRYCRLLPLLSQREEVGIDLVRRSRRHSVREARIHPKHRTLTSFADLQRRRADGYDLVIVAVKNESGHVELLRSSVMSVSEKALVHS
jgi:hypothetical protein